MTKEERKLKKQSDQQQVKQQIKDLQQEVRRCLATGNLKGVSDNMDKLNRLREASR